MGEADFSYRGDLAATPLPRVLATVQRHQVPGELELERDDQRRRLAFDDGRVVFASSTDRSESLGEFLLRNGRITRAQYEVSCEELDRSEGLRHGAVLVQMGFLSPDELTVALREQVQQILWNLFNWDRGTVVCRFGRVGAAGSHGISFPIPRLILAGCKRIADVRVATDRLGGRQTVLLRQEWPPHLSELRLEAGERTLLDLVDGKRTLYELCQKGPMSPGINARILYAFSELDMVGRDTGYIKIQVRSAPKSRQE